MKEWEIGLPRAQYRQFTKISQSQPWFEVYDIGHDIYAVYEPYHVQEVISYLIQGQDRALLWDTGMGIGNIKRLTDELWGKELIVCNSHHHFDHIGGDPAFETVYVLNHPVMMQALKTPLTDSFLARNYGADAFSDRSPLSSYEYQFKVTHAVPIANGHIFDLGGCQLEVMHTPGHSKDSIALIDRRRRLLFTGDTYYPGPLYCFEEPIAEYADTMRKLADAFADYTLITSHNEPLRDGRILSGVADDLQAIASGKVSCRTREEYHIYEMKHCCVWTRKEGETT